MHAQIQQLGMRFVVFCWLIASQPMPCACLLQVQGSRPADQYTVFPSHFCTCHAFLYLVVGQDHILVSLASQAVYKPAWGLTRPPFLNVDAKGKETS